MKNIFKNKLLIILVLIALFITSMCSSVFADNETVEVNYPTEILVDGVQYLFCRNPETSELDLYTFSSGVSIDSYSVDNGQLKVFIPAFESYSFYKYDFETGSYILLATVSRNFNTAYIFYTFSTQRLLSYELSNPSDLSIPIVDSPRLVFQGAPQAQVAQVELMKATQVQEILPQIIAVVEIVLPIFLGIFGVLLVLYLIKSKNLLHL